MVRLLFWKEKVVRSVMVLIPFGLFLSSAQAQNPADAKLSCSFQSAPLESVIDYLSQSTGVYFVYSSDKVKISQSISLRVDNKTLRETLGLLGKELDLLFKLEGRHVVIKSADLVKPKISRKQAKTHATASDSQNAVLLAPNEGRKTQTIFFSPIPPETFSLRPPDAQMQQRLKQLQPYFDSNLLKKIPATYVRKLSSKDVDLGWYFSVGPMISDIGPSIELQGGLKSIYAVFSPFWAKSGTLNVSYGLGTYVKLAKNFSFSPIYTFSQTTSMQEEGYTMGNILLPFTINKKLQHHQLRLRLQYAITPAIRFTAGPTLNQTKAVTQYDQGNVISVNVVEFPGNSSDSNTIGHPSNQGTYYRYDYDFWLGWEAGAYFKVNFSKQP